MLSLFVLVGMVTMSQCSFPEIQRLTPHLVWVVLSREYGYGVLRGTSENAHSWGEFGGRVRGVPVVKDSPLERVDIQRAIMSCVADEESLHSFYPNLCSAVAMGMRPN